MKRSSEPDATDIGPWTHDELYQREAKPGVTVRNPFKPSTPAT